MALFNGDSLTDALTRWFGHADFRPGQREIVAAAVDGVDLLALLPTGGGKSICYQVPALLGEGLTLVLSPLVALMKDQVDSLPEAVRPVATWVGAALPAEERQTRLGRLAEGRLKLLYAAPERLRSSDFLELLANVRLERVVVDEAHCISEWGHDFRPDYRAIGQLIRELTPRHVMAVTATAPPRVRDDIEARLGRPLRRFLKPAHRQNLHLSVIQLRSESAKLGWVHGAVASMSGQGLIYASSRRKCEHVAQILTQNGVRAGFYHAGLERDARSRSQDRFMEGKMDVMVATVAFGMGIDKPDIRYLIHFQPSHSIENYTQEAGRAGRDGNQAWCALLAAPVDLRQLTAHHVDGALTIDHVRGVYHELRQMARNRLVHLDLDSSAVAGNSPLAWTRTLPILEETGLIVRHPDAWLSGAMSLPTTETRRMEANTDSTETPESPGKTSRVRNGMRRFLEIELQVPAPDARDRVERLLQDRRLANEARRRALSQYIQLDRCRHRRIAEYYGDPWVNRKCGRCDCCGGEGGPDRARIRQEMRNRLRQRRDSHTLEIDHGSALWTDLVHWRRETAAMRRVPAFAVLPNTVLERIWADRPATVEALRHVPGIGEYRAREFGDSVVRIVARHDRSETGLVRANGKRR